jgi:hypothetical protein
MTIGIGNEWDPGDPLEVHYERSTTMASRGISLGRIIEWFRTCDAEEGNFALQRAGTILAERKSILQPAAGARKARKPSHHKKPLVEGTSNTVEQAQAAASS